MVRWGLVVALLGLTVSRVLGAPAANTCELFRPGAAATATSTTCLRCHDASGVNHPFDIDYAAAVSRTAAKSPMLRLRPANDVLERGVLLHDGKITCLTCHDGHSRSRHALVAPRMTSRQQSEAARDERVATAMLCTTCHAVD